MRILLADGQDRVRYALRALLAMQVDTEVVAEATNAAELFDQTRCALPDLILLDWELPGLAISDALPQLRKAHPCVQIVVLSGQPDVRATALAAGADGFVSKAQPPDRLLDAIHASQYQIDLRRAASANLLRGTP
jgi:DNA-binding NarL/FixJ family response regulator